VLDIGPAYGYSSAIIAHMAEAVVGVEPDAELAEEAQRILSEHDVDNVLVQQADLTAGAPEHGPYDAVAVQGGIERLPDAIAAQIKDGGRIACIFMQGTMGVVRIGYKYDGRITWRDSFDAGAPVLPGFEKRSEFAL
jgi:protein-L-isoaspartate(D-aspartate) O-methyltransferase